MTKFYALIAIIFISQSFLLAQPTITIGTLNGCVPGTTINVPVSVANFTSTIQSFSCTVAYNPAVVTYITHQNVCMALQSAFLVTNASNNLVAVAWFGVSPINYPTGQIFDLQFNYLGGNCLLTWDPLCGGGITYNNGSVAGPLGFNDDLGVNSSGLIFPNPAQNSIQINTKQDLQYEILNDLSTLIRPLRNYKSGDEIDVSGLKSGIYFIRLYVNEKQSAIQKFIKLPN